MVLASLAVQPALWFGGSAVGLDWSPQRTLLVLALIANGLCYGFRRTINWPIAALAVAFALGLLAGDLHPRLTPGFMVASFAILALPWCFTQVDLEPGSRRLYVLVMALVPILSVLIGIGLDEGDIAAVFAYRLAGAVGNAEAFGVLAFAGFAVALAEASRPDRGFAGPLAVINLALVVLSGTRMAIFASSVLLVVYGALSRTLRERVREHAAAALLGAVVIVATLVWYWPTLEGRLQAGPAESLVVGDTVLAVDLSGRDQVWGFYFEEFLLSPLFGRGMGSGFVAAADWLQFTRETPHNEYLHLLVTLGAVGFVLFAGAIVLWYRQLLQAASDHDRTFLIAIVPALAVFATTTDVVVYFTAVMLYAYFGVLMSGAGAPSAAWHATNPRSSMDHGGLRELEG